MKTKPIHTVDQLHGEIARLSALAKDQEQRIKEDVKQIREELRPENLAVSALSAITGIRLNRNEFLKKGFAVGIGLLLQRFVFKTESKLEQKVYHWLVLRAKVNDFFRGKSIRINPQSHRGDIHQPSRLNIIRIYIC